MSINERLMLFYFMKNIIEIFRKSNTIDLWVGCPDHLTGEGKGGGMVEVKPN